MNSDLRGVQVGDWIWTIQEGWEKVVATKEVLNGYSIETRAATYTLDGKSYLNDKYPSAFLEPPEEFNAVPKPCEFKKGDRVLVGDSLESCNQRKYFSHIDSEGNFHCFPFGKTEWTAEEEGGTSVWKYYKKWEK